MRRRILVAVGLCALLLAIGGPLAAQAAGLPSPADLRIAKSAYEAGEKRQWAQHRSAVARVKDPLLRNLLTWHRLTSYSAEVSFEELDLFLAATPDWPYRERLMQRAEDSMSPAYPDAEVVKWYGTRMPATPEGATRLAEALFALDRGADARRMVQRTWIDGSFGAQQERQFYGGFRKHLTREDHVARLDRLVWAGHRSSAKRMYARVGNDYRALAEARFALHDLAPGVDGAIARVPEALRDDPGLVYERLRWRRIKGRDHDAIEMLPSPAPNDLVQARRWWYERNQLARRALMNGHISDAYRISAEHGQQDGAELLDAEWMAGWIALRFLKDNAIAYRHFATLFREANYPISRARGAYWAGRAAEAMDDRKRARFWYLTAFRYPTTYYGQLAATKLPREDTLNLPSLPHTDPVVAASFGSHELVRAVRILDAAGMTEMLRPFIRQLTDIGKTPDWLAKVANLAVESGRADLAIFAAKKAEVEGVSLIDAGYPLLDGEMAGAVEVPLIHAVIRQESAFNKEAVSSAGARGLMQLMPRTAAHVAKKTSVAFVQARLTEDPDYNIRLGQAYLADLVAEFDGSYILALAAYNAGPARARQWIRDFGDPRDPTIDTVDWIESVPFSETRNYLQRVLENLQVYRHILTPTLVALTPENMVRR